MRDSESSYSIHLSETSLKLDLLHLILTMKRPLLLLALIGLVACLSACAFPSQIQWVHTERYVPSSPGVIGPLYVINGVELQQYSPKLYTPFLYDHRGLVDNQFYHAQALRHPARRGSVHVGPMTPLAPLPPFGLQASTRHAPAYEVRRATLVR